MTRHFGQRAIERAAAIHEPLANTIPVTNSTSWRQGSFRDQKQSGRDYWGRKIWAGDLRGFPRCMTAALAAFCTLTFVPAPGFQKKRSYEKRPHEKIGQEGFTSVEQALRAGIHDLKAGDASSLVAASTRPLKVASR